MNLMGYIIGSKHWTSLSYFKINIEINWSYLLSINLGTIKWLKVLKLTGQWGAKILISELAMIWRLLMKNRKVQSSQFSMNLILNLVVQVLVENTTKLVSFYYLKRPSNTFQIYIYIYIYIFIYLYIYNFYSNILTIHLNF